MSLSRISSRFPRIVLAQLRNSSVISTRHSRPSNQFHSIGEPHSKVVAGQMSLFHHSSLNASAFQRFGFSSVPSPETPEQREVPISRDSEEELTMDDLVKLVTEKEELLKVKHKEIEKMQDKILRTYADMENVMDRARREAENSKKFAIQNFAKSLLDVADNLGRASSVVKDGFSKIDTSKDTSGAVPLLKTLLEGVEMTEKQLIEVVGGQVSPFHHSLPNASAFQRFGFSSVPSPKNAAKENSPAAKGPSTVENNGAKPNASGDAEAPERREAPICEDLSKELAMEDRVKLVTEKVQLLKGKVEKIEKMQHKVVRTCKVMEKVAEKDRRDINYAIKKANLAIIITNLAILLVTISSR